MKKFLKFVLGIVLPLSIFMFLLTFIQNSQNKAKESDSSKKTSLNIALVNEDSGSEFDG